MSTRFSERPRRHNTRRAQDMGRSTKPDATASRTARVLGEGVRTQWLRPAVIAALSAALVAQGAETGARLWRLGREPSVTRAPPAVLPAAPRAELTVPALVAAHLFGNAPEVAADEPKEAPAQWVLTGTLPGGTPAAGGAILGRTATTTRFCAAGQEVAAGFRLVEVFTDRVTLEGEGERVSLKLPRAMRTPAVLASPGTRLAAAAEPRAQRPLEERIRERPQNQTPALLELRPSLHRGIGRFDGMRVWGTGDGSNLASYGLRRNDIIRAVDGEPVDNMQAEYRALQTLSRGHPVDVTVQRNGDVFTLQLGFNDTGS